MAELPRPAIGPDDLRSAPPPSVALRESGPRHRSSRATALHSGGSPHGVGDSLHAGHLSTDDGRGRVRGGAACGTWRPAVILFGLPAEKDSARQGAYDESGVVQQAVPCGGRGQPRISSR